MARTVPPEILRARELQRRLDQILSDLGLGDVFSRRWVTPARSSFYFAPHNLRQADALVRGLKQLGVLLDGAGLEAAGPVGAGPASGQLTFRFGADAGGPGGPRRAGPGDDRTPVWDGAPATRTGTMIL